MARFGGTAGGRFALVCSVLLVARANEVVGADGNIIMGEVASPPLVEWISGAGGFLRFSDTGSEDGPHAVASEAVDAGDPIAMLPADRVILADYHLMEELHTAETYVPNFQRLCVFLATELGNADSEWAPYFQTLPKPAAFEGKLPQYLDDDAKAALYKVLPKFKEDLDWENFYPPGEAGVVIYDPEIDSRADAVSEWVSENEDRTPTAVFTTDEYHYAVSVARTRAFPREKFHDCLFKDRAEPEAHAEERAADTEYVMVPGTDALKHDSSAGLTACPGWNDEEGTFAEGVEEEGKALVLTMPAAVTAGDEVAQRHFEDIRKCNYYVWSTWGYSIEPGQFGNEEENHDCLFQTFSVKTSPPKKAKLRQEVFDRSIAKLEGVDISVKFQEFVDFSISLEGLFTSEGLTNDHYLMIIARALLLNERELNYLKEHPEDDVSEFFTVANELRAMNLMAKLVNEAEDVLNRQGCAMHDEIEAMDPDMKAHYKRIVDGSYRVATRVRKDISTAALDAVIVDSDVATRKLLRKVMDEVMRVDKPLLPCALLQYENEQKAAAKKGKTADKEGEAMPKLKPNKQGVVRSEHRTGQDRTGQG